MICFSACRSTLYMPGSRSSKDRKSTRLNSSHLVISYAVFCLKKKKHHLHRSCLLNELRPLVALAFRAHHPTDPSHLLLGETAHLWHSLTELLQLHLVVVDPERYVSQVLTAGLT